MNRIYATAFAVIIAGFSTMAANQSIAANNGVISARDFNQEESVTGESTERILAEDGHIGNTQDGDILKYGLYSPGGVYSVTLRCANGLDREVPSVFALYIGSQAVGTGDVESKGWGEYYDVSVNDVVIEEGDFVFGLKIERAPINIETITFTRTGDVGDVAKYPTIPATIGAKTYDTSLSQLNERIIVEESGNIGNTANGDFFAYCLTNTKGGAYSIKINGANGKSDREEPSQFTVFIDGIAKASGVFEAKGWGTYFDVVVNDIVIPEGDFVFGFQVDLEPINIMSYTFEYTGSGEDIPDYIAIPGIILAKDYNKEKSVVNDRLLVEEGGNIGNTANEDKLVYDFTCLETGLYNITLNGANGKGDREDPSLASVSIDSENVGQLTFENKGWGTYQNKTIENIQITEGNHQLTIVIDLEPINLMSITLEKVSGDVSALKDIDTGNDASVYYNLQGARIENPSNGIYIRVNGNKTSKVMIR